MGSGAEEEGEAREAALDELAATEHILKASTNRLITDRKSGISPEMETYIQGQEVTSPISHLPTVVQGTEQRTELSGEAHQTLQPRPRSHRAPPGTPE